MPHSKRTNPPKALLLIAVLFLLPKGDVSLAGDFSESRSLGVAVRSMTVWDSIVVRENEKPVLYAGTYTGVGNARVIRYDYTHESVAYFPLPDAKGGYGLAWDNGTLYVGTIEKANLFRIRASDGEVTNLGSPAPEEQYIWKLDRASNGRIYACTYPGAKLLEYNPVTGQMRDHGAMHSDRQYAIAVAAGEGSRVFVGIGTPAALVVHDTATGETAEMPLYGHEGAAFAYPIHDQGLLYVRFAGDDSILVFDANTLALLLELDSTETGIKYGIAKPIAGVPIRITGLPDGPKVYDSVDRRLVDFAGDIPPLYDPLSGVRFEVSPVAVSAFRHGTDEPLGHVDISKDGDGMGIMSVAVGPDGCVYGGVYNLLHLWKYDPEAGTLRDLGTATPGHSGQYYDFCSVGSRLYMGSYTHAVLTVHETSRSWNPFGASDPNPRTIGPIGQSQYRPLTLLAGNDGKVYVGSTPTYGQVGGALSALDTQTEELVVWRNVVGDHSVSSLAQTPGGRLLVGTTLFSSTTGHGFDPAEARVIEWDGERARVGFNTAPVPKARTIHSLLAMDDESLVGSADSTLFLMDMATGEVTHAVPSGVGAVTRLRHGPDGGIYGMSPEALVRVQIAGSSIGEVKRLGLGGVDFDISSRGDLYFGRGTELLVHQGLAAPEDSHLLER